VKLSLLLKPKLTIPKLKIWRKKLADMNENFEVVKAKQEISEWTSSRLEKNVEELCDSRERCYEKSLECARKLKDIFVTPGKGVMKNPWSARRS
jgi:glucosamine 6-phosphate synthetase-like amidotransferase/phosphosugar isomerase protein